MTDVVAWWVGTTTGVVHDDAATRTFASPGYGTFRTRDDQWIALGVLGEQRLWDAIARALRLEHLVGVAFADRLARTAAVNQEITERIAGLDRDDVLARLDAEGAPVSPVLTPEEATRQPQLQSRDIHVRTAAGVVVGLPARFGDGAPSPPRDLPAVGAHPDGFGPPTR